MIYNFIKTGWRKLRRSILFSAVNVLGLAVSFSCCFLILLYILDEISFDRFHSNFSRLYRVTLTVSDSAGVAADFVTGNSVFPIGPVMKDNIPEVESFVRTANDFTPYVLRVNDDLFFQTPLYADSNFFNLFSFPLLFGNSKDVLNATNSAVITEDLALKYFGTTNAIGKPLPLRIRDSLSTFYVTGVASSVPRNSSVDFDLVLPMTFFEQRIARKNFQWIDAQVTTYIQLAPYVDAKHSRLKLQGIVNKYADEQLQYSAKFTGQRLRHRYELQPFVDVHLNAKINQGTYPMPNDGGSYWYIYTLSIIALLILLIACMNFVNLSLADSVRRSREVGVRRVVGSSKTQLVVQFIGEAMFPCVLSFFVAVGGAYLLLPIFNQLTGKQLTLLAELSTPSVIFGCMALIILSSILVGWYPAWIISLYSTVDTLNGKVKAFRRSYVPRFLVIVQFTLTIFLTIGALTMGSQFKLLTTKNLGYNERNLLKIQLPPAGSEPIERVIRDMARTRPEIISVSGSSNAYNSGYMETVKTGPNQVNAFGAGVDEFFLQTLGIELRAGRNFSSSSPASLTEGILVNEAFAAESGINEIVGETFTLMSAGQSVNVSGTMKDFNYWSLQSQVKPLFYFYQANSHNELWVRAAPGKLSKVISLIAANYKRIVHEFPFSYEIVEQSNDKMYHKESEWKDMLSYGTIVAILISCIGLFGFTAVSSEQRTKEIGIRKLLGASGCEVFTLFLRDFIPLVLVAILFAIPIGYLAGDKWLQNFYNRIHLEWWIFFVPSLAAVAIAILTIAVYTTVTLMRGPIHALRKD